MKRRDLLTLSIALPGNEPPKEFRIFAAGMNPSRKGPTLFDDEAARQVMAEYRQHGADVMLDLEHLSLDDEAKNYDPDARGWCRLELRDGELWAVDVRWTPDGERRLEEKRQRYISPAFARDPKTKRVTELVNIAITSLPATDHLTPLVAARATSRSRGTMLNPKLLAALGLPEDASDEDVAKAMDEAMKDPAKMAAMLSAAFTADDQGESETLSEDEGDDEDEDKKAPPAPPAKAAKRSRVDSEMAAELVALKAQVNAGQVRDLLRANRTKLTPALEKWALKAFASSPESLEEWLSAQPVIATSQRHQEKKSSTGATVKLTREDVELCKKLGRDPKEFLAHKRELAIAQNPMLLNEEEV